MPHGLVVTQSGNDITISGVSLTTGPAADPVGVQVDLDESDSDLVIDTDGVDSNPIELSYAQVTWATCDAGSTPSICDDTDEELQGIASGDTDATDTEVDGALPLFLSATSGDTDADGTVDQLTITFSELIDVADGNAGDGLDSITLTNGCTIANGDYAATATSTLVLTLTGCTAGDTSITVDPTYVATGNNDITEVSPAPNELANATTVSGTDGAAPAPLSAIYLDTDADGSIDRVDVTWSELFTLDEFETGDHFFSPGSLFNFTATAASVNGAVLELTVTPTGTALTGSVTAPTYAYTNQATAGSVKDALGNESVTSSALDIADGAAPVPVSAFYLDTNGDGTIDRVDVTFSNEETALVLNEFDAGDHIFSAGTAFGTITATAAAVNGQKLEIDITVSESNTTGSAVAPTYTYTNQGTTGSVADSTGNESATSAAVTIVDNAAPIPVYANYLDTNDDGTVDQVDVVWSEEITLNEFEAGDHVFSSGSALGAITPTAAVANSSTLEIDVTVANANVTGSAAAPTYTYTDQGTDESLQDTNTNYAVTASALNITDGAAPVPTSAEYLDTNADGTVDRVTIAYTDEVTMVLNEFEAGDHVFSSGSALGAITPTGAAFNGNTLEINVNVANANVTGSAVAPTYTYTNQGTGGSVQDGPGNDVQTMGAGMDVDDSAAPQILSVKYLDTNTNGTVDRVDVTWTESVSLNEFEAGDHVFSAGSALGAITPTGATANGAVIEIAVTVANANITATPAAPTYTYTDQGTTGSLRDSALNVAATSAATAIDDGAAPILVSAQMQDSNGNGIIDRIALSYTENLADTAAAANGFDVTSVTDHGACTGESADPAVSGSLNVNFTCTLVNTTVGDLTLTFTANAGIADAAGNQSPSKVITSGSTPALTDGAAPVVYGTLSYLDTNADGQIDRVAIELSEAASYTYQDSDWAATANGLTGFDVSGCVSCTSTMVLQLSATAAADLTGVSGGTEPQLAFTPGNNISDGFGNNMAAIGATSLTDGAAPLPISAQYLDTDADGTIDRADVTWTEAINDNIFEAGDHVFSAGSALGAITATGITSNAAVLEISITPTNGAVTGSAVAPTYTYTEQGASGSIDDGNGNDALTPGPITVDDAAAPAPVSGEYRDMNGDGTIDRADITWSFEPTYSLDEFEAADHVFNAGSTFGAVTATAASFTGSVLQVTITPTNTGVTGSSVALTYTYTNTDTNGSINDGGAGNETPTMSALSLDDAAAPAPVFAEYVDGNTDGTIDMVIVSWSDEDAAITLNEFEAGDHVFSSGSALGAITATGASFNGDALEIPVTVANANVTGSAVAPTYTYTNQGTAGSIEDASANVTPTTATPVMLADSAAPVIITATPAQGATNVSRSINVVVNFTEAMVAANGLSDDDNNAYSSQTWTNGGKTLTGVHNNWSPSKVVTVTVAANASTGGPTALAGDDDFSFTTANAGGGGGGGGGGAGGVTPIGSIAINGGAAATTSRDVTVSITQSNAYEVILSEDSSFLNASYQLISATKPFTLSEGQGTKTIYAYLRTSGGVVSTLMSDTIVYNSAATAEETTAPADEPTPSDLILHDPAPAGALPAEVAVGQLVKNAGISSVYFIDNDNRRHSFPNQDVYFSWFKDFSAVRTVSDNVLAQIPLGKNVTMRPGSYLVKITTDPKVYAVEPYGVLRPIASEAAAAALYGPSWATRVRDVADTFFINYQMGSVLNGGTHPTGTLLRYDGQTDYRYVSGGNAQAVDASTFAANYFKDEFVTTGFNQTLSYPGVGAMPIAPIDQLMMIL